MCVVAQAVGVMYVGPVVECSRVGCRVGCNRADDPLTVLVSDTLSLNRSMAYRKQKKKMNDWGALSMFV